MLFNIASFLFVALVSSSPLSLRPRTTCYSGVYVIGARGSDEAEGYGKVASVVNGVLAAIPKSGSIALDYPASVIDPSYSESVIDGINTIISLIQSYVDDCGGNIVLVGFSQGGNVITDALAGDAGKPTPIAASYVKHSKVPTR